MLKEVWCGLSAGTPSELDYEPEKIKKQLDDLWEQWLKVRQPQRPSNLFQLVRRTDHELSHSRILAYLLNPDAPHGLDAAFLDGFLAALRIPVRRGIGPVRVHLEVRARAEGGESAQADIVVELRDDGDRSPGDVIVIENKIRASEGPAQTVRLQRSFDTKFAPRQVHYVYLTAAGVPPANQAFRVCTYQQVADVVGHLLADVHRSMPVDTWILLREFHRHLKEDVLMSGSVWTGPSGYGRLYARYYEAIRDVRKAYEEDTGRLANGWFDLVSSILPSDGWKSYAYKQGYQQVWKDAWWQPGWYVHFETFINYHDLIQGKVPFYLDIERGSTEHDCSGEVRERLRENSAFRDVVQRIGAQFVENDPFHVVSKTYAVDRDLSDVIDVLRRALEEHRELIPIIDDTLNAMREERGG